MSGQVWVVAFKSPTGKVHRKQLVLKTCDSDEARCLAWADREARRDAREGWRLLTVHHAGEARRGGSL